MFIQIVSFKKLIYFIYFIFAKTFNYKIEHIFRLMSQKINLHMFCLFVILDSLDYCRIIFQYDAR